MDVQNKIVELYRPFRNHVSKAKLIDSLLAIHAHSQFQQFSSNLPNYVYNLPPGYSSTTDFSQPTKYHLHIWEMQILVKELIMYGQLYGGKKNYLNWNHLVDAINRLKALEGEIAKIYITKDNVLVELNRIAHRMFHLQHRPSNQDFARYWILYSDQELEKLIYKTIGLTVEEIFLISLACTGFYIKKFAMYYPPDIRLKGITQEKIDRYFSHFSISYESLKEKLKGEQTFDEKYVYAYSAYYKYPIIRLPYEEKDSLVCPIPRLLVERFTNGLYYEICNSTNFDHIFGEAYQNFIGNLLSKVYSNQEIFSESTYKTKYGEKRTVDWIVDDGSSTLFIECKTKRLRLGAKIGLLDLTEVNRELDKMADFILQVYKSVLDYKAGYYSKYVYKREKKINVMIVTLEEWFLFGNNLSVSLNTKVNNKLKDNNISLEIVKEHPYIVASTEDFEKFIQICKKATIQNVITARINNKEKQDWHLLNFLISEFKKEYLETKSLLKKDYDELIEDLLEKYGTPPGKQSIA
ncbi:hypothetical protein B6D29_02280 [Microgenomates bacterium UTCPR1]|nr:MAG: hypothetical protein B6D29_02280 [Microgenomates bacterium UTCPR1]